MTASRTPAFRSLAGMNLGLGPKNNLITARGTQITRPCVDASITVGNESADVRAITITLKDAKGVAIDYAEMVELVVLLNSGGTDFVATGGSTGIAIGASGKLLTVVAKKLFRAISTTSGAIALTWTDSGTEVAYLGVRLPNGRVVISSALTNT